MPWKPEEVVPGVHKVLRGLDGPVGTEDIGATD